MPRPAVGLFQAIFVPEGPNAAQVEKLGDRSYPIYPEQVWDIRNPRSRNDLYAQALKGCRRWSGPYVIKEIDWYGTNDTRIGCAWSRSKVVKNLDEGWSLVIVANRISRENLRR